MLSLNAINPHNLHLCSSQHYAHFHCAMHVNAHFMITLIVLNCRLEDTNMRSIKKVSPNCNLPSSISSKLVTVSLILVIQFTQITNDFCTDFVSFFRLQHAHEFFAFLISLKKASHTCFLMYSAASITFYFLSATNFSLFLEHDVNQSKICHSTKYRYSSSS